MRVREQKGRRLASLVLTLTLVAVALPLVSRAEAAPRDPVGFPDVPDTHPFYDEIMWMAGQGFVAGFDDGNYRPEQGVTRQGLVQILWRMSGEPEGPFAPEFFTDVTPIHPFYTAIRWASHNDVVRGFPDGTFRGGSIVSRQAMGALLHRLSGIETSYGTLYDGLSLDPLFTDVSPTTHPFRNDIAWWVFSGQADGFDDGTFRPMSAVTRQSAAAFLARFFDMMGGYWPHVSHHDHVCDTEQTPAQAAAADELYDTMQTVIATYFPTKAAALAAGYRVNTPPFAGEGEHMVHNDYTQDGLVLDPMKPESLVVDADGVHIAAAMFVREYVGPGPVWPPEPGGCETLWHGHDNLCYDEPLLHPESRVWFIAGLFNLPCPNDDMVRVTPEMLHVWREGYWDGGRFDGIET